MDPCELHTQLLVCERARPHTFVTLHCCNVAMLVAVLSGPGIHAKPVAAQHFSPTGLLRTAAPSPAPGGIPRPTTAQAVPAPVRSPPLSDSRCPACNFASA